MRRRLAFVLAACLLALAPVSEAHEIVVNFPRPESGPDERSLYPIGLLREALKRSGKPYRVQLYPVRMQQGRALLRLRGNEGIDVVSTMTSIERERDLQPIRIPIDKGLIGWRLLLIQKSQQQRLSGITSLDELRRFKAGQGTDWPDTPILRANGLPVYGTTNYEALFRMLENERIDYFPRAVGEIWAEVDARPALMVEPSLVLHYPTSLYFFVRKGDTALGADLTAGLEKMIADGSFERRFQQYFGPLIKRAGLKGRRVLTLRNPLMPPSMPLARRELWFQQ